MEKTEKTYLKIACVVPLFWIKVLKTLERLLKFPSGSVVREDPVLPLQGAECHIGLPSAFSVGIAFKYATICLKKYY